MATTNNTYTKDEQDRINAVSRYLKGEKHSKICMNLGISGKWLYKWIGRYKNAKRGDKRKWFQEHSRAPKNVHRKTDPEIEKLVVNVRKSLVEGKTEDTKYRCIGAEEIEFRMDELGYSEKEIPSIPTIKRIIKRNKLIKQKRKRYVRCKSKKRYTLLNPTKVNEMHQIDIVGPRYIKGYGAISSINMIDVAGNKAHIKQYTSGTLDYVLELLQDYWTKNAIPNYLQMDNGGCFIGDLKHPRHFSRVVRLCMYLGIEPVFIAQSKPWMNGSIESFNDEFEEKLWSKENFKYLEHIRRESKIFLVRHNNRQDWKNRKTTLEKIPIRKIPQDFKIDANNLPLTKGKVHFIREVNKDGKINVLNEDFHVDKSLAHDYVWATINTKEKHLTVYHREKKADEARLVKTHRYKIDEMVMASNLNF